VNSFSTALSNFTTLNLRTRCGPRQLTLYPVGVGQGCPTRGSDGPAGGVRARAFLPAEMSLSFTTAAAADALLPADFLELLFASATKPCSCPEGRDGAFTSLRSLNQPAHISNQRARGDASDWRATANLQGTRA
jgi:hypothetical protein